MGSVSGTFVARGQLQWHIGGVRVGHTFSRGPAWRRLHAPLGVALAAVELRASPLGSDPAPVAAMLAAFALQHPGAELWRGFGGGVGLWGRRGRRGPRGVREREACLRVCERHRAGAWGTNQGRTARGHLPQTVQRGALSRGKRLRDIQIVTSGLVFVRGNIYPASRYARVIGFPRCVAMLHPKMMQR